MKIKIVAPTKVGLIEKVRELKFKVGLLGILEEIERGVCEGPLGLCVYITFSLTLVPIPISDSSDLIS